MTYSSCTSNNHRNNIPYHDEPGDKPLIERISWKRRALCLLLLLDSLFLLFVDGDMRELKMMGLPVWWWVLPVAAHIALTFWLNFYFATARKYLCLQDSAAKICAMPSAERRTEYQRRNRLAGLAAGFCIIMLVATSLLPHILTADKSFVRFEVGLIIFKTTLLVASMQVILFLHGVLDIKQSIAEWRGLLAEYPSLNFPRYAEFYDGYDDSIEP